VRANVSLALCPPPQRTPFKSLCCCQVKAWKAGHKGGLCRYSRTLPLDSARTAAGPMAAQKHIFHLNTLSKLVRLGADADWQGVVAQDHAAREAAAIMLAAPPDRST
jgi:hypothetical protein